MSIRARATGGLSRFAHLAGISTPKPKAEDAPPDPATKEELEEVKEDLEEVQEDVKDLEDDHDDLEEEVDDKADMPPDDKPAEKAAYRTGRAVGRKAERVRCANIMGSKAAASNIILAAHLAFEGNLSSKAAVAMLKASAQGASAGNPAPKPAAAATPAAKPGLDARMAIAKPVQVGSNPAAAPNRDTAEGTSAYVLDCARRAGVLR